MIVYRRTTPKARRIFGTVLTLNVSCIVWVHYDQGAQMRRMHAGVALDTARLEKKLMDRGIDRGALFRVNKGVEEQSYPKEHALAKYHKPVPPENIPELAELGVTRESSFVPGMDRPDVDMNQITY